ncbi:hypothetical protein LY78DRAFT_404597 [Colletotrichum sublineola]|nr:hypothetical protein LY78DRAFT_404597 [Colletotrichum sublineola]
MVAWSHSFNHLLRPLSCGVAPVPIVSATSISRYVFQLVAISSPNGRPSLAPRFHQPLAGGSVERGQEKAQTSGATGEVSGGDIEPFLPYNLGNISVLFGLTINPSNSYLKDLQKLRVYIVVRVEQAVTNHNLGFLPSGKAARGQLS